MEALPSSLLYYTQQIANFTRNQIKINPLNTNTLKSDGAQQLRVSLPVNSIANMKSLTMHTKMTVKGVEENPAGSGANAKGGLIPRGGAAAVLDRVTFACGGVSLDNGTTPYYAVQAVRENLKKGSQKYMSDDCVIAQGVLEEHETIPAGGADQSRKLAVTNFGGFTECEPCFLDLNLIPEVQVTIQLAPAYTVPFQWQNRALGEDKIVAADNTTECQFELADIYFSLEVIQIGSGIYDALTQRVMAERGSLDVPYPQFQVFRSSSGTQSATGSVSCMSLDRIMVVNRGRGSASEDSEKYPDYQTQSHAHGPVPGSKTWSCTQLATKFCDNSKTTAAPTGAPSTWQMQVNNAPRPLYRVDTEAESFAIAVNADDRTYSHSRGGLVSSQDMWKDWAWCAVQRLKFDEDPRRLSGLNLSSINSQLAYTPTPNIPGCEVLMITEQTSILRIGGGRAVAVVA